MVQPTLPPTYFLRVGERITYYRTRAGISVDDMAKMLEISKSTMHNIEHGVGGLRMDRAHIIALACRVTLNDLVVGAV